MVLAACGSLRGNSAAAAVSSIAAQDGAPAVLTQDVELDDVSFASVDDGENALRVGLGSVVLRRAVVKKTGVAQTGWQNAALYIADGAQAQLEQVDVSSSAPGGGIYVQGENGQLELTDCAVTTTAEGAHGLYSAGGLSAHDLTVTTSGEGACPLYIQGGAAQISGGAYTSGGCNAPVLYAASEVEVRDADLLANNASVLMLENGAALTMRDCSLHGGLAATEDTEGQPALLITGPGSSETQTAEVYIQGGSLTARENLLEARQERCDLHLESVALSIPQEARLFWIHDGAQVELFVLDQTMSGGVTVGGDSSLALTLSGDSDFTGSFTTEENAFASVYLSTGSRWTLTADSTLSELQNEGQIVYNGHSITMADGTVFRG